MGAFYAWSALIVGLMVGGGLIGLITNHDATAYQLANKEMVPATVTALKSVRVDVNHNGKLVEECSVTLDESGRSLTVVTDDTNPCDTADDPLRVGTHVEVEYRNGKATAIYDDNLSWPTLDNPGHSAALTAAAVFFGGLYGAFVLAVGLIHLAIWLIARKVRRHEPPPAKRDSAPPPPETPQTNWSVYPPE